MCAANDFEGNRMPNSPQADRAFYWMLAALLILGVVVVYSFYW